MQPRPTLHWRQLRSGLATSSGRIFENQSLGGDALGGYVLRGHYYVGAHGAYTEVAQSVWEWSRIHSLSVFVTHPLAIVGIAWLVFNKAFGEVAGMSIGVRTHRQALVAGSGPRLAYKRCAVHLGATRLNGPFVGVSAFPAGILLKPILTRPRVILATELRRAGVHRARFGGSVEFIHVSPECASPVKLFVDPDGTMSLAIERIFKNREDMARIHDGAIVAEAAGARRPALPRLVEIGIGAIGIGVFAAMFFVGVTSVLPEFGTFGLLWFGGLVGIAALNIRNYLRRRRAGP